jgi:hypothetical protein
VELEPGEHRFRQVIPGYRETTHVVAVTAGDPRVTLRLPPFGILTVINDFEVPSRGAKVLVGGRDVGPLPLRDVKIAAGTIELAVVWPDGSRFDESFTLPAGGVVRRIVRPSPAPPAP